MKIELNISNKSAYTIIIVFIFLLLGAGVYAYTQSIPNPGHGADNVLISIGGAEKTLQQAIDDGDFESNGATYLGDCNVTGRNAACGSGDSVCKCNNGENIMLMRGQTAGPVGECSVINQGSINVKGRCDGCTAVTGAAFSCFKIE